MALAEVYIEVWVYCSCGEFKRVTNGGINLTGHQFADPPHTTEMVHDMAVEIVSAVLWVTSAIAGPSPVGQSADLQQWQNSAGEVMARIPSP